MNAMNDMKNRKNVNTTGVTTPETIFPDVQLPPHMAIAAISKTMKKYSFDLI